MYRLAHHVLDEHPLGTTSFLPLFTATSSGWVNRLGRGYQRTAGWASRSAALRPAPAAAQHRRAAGSSPVPPVWQTIANGVPAPAAWGAQPWQMPRPPTADSFAMPQQFQQRHAVERLRLGQMLRGYRAAALDQVARGVSRVAFDAKRAVVAAATIALGSGTDSPPASPA